MHGMVKAGPPALVVSAVNAGLYTIEGNVSSQYGTSLGVYYCLSALQDSWHAACKEVYAGQRLIDVTLQDH
jgi:hypothetical protein